MGYISFVSPYSVNIGNFIGIYLNVTFIFYQLELIGSSLSSVSKTMTIIKDLHTNLAISNTLLVGIINETNQKKQLLQPLSDFTCSKISAKNLTVTYNENTILDDINWEWYKNQIVILWGDSGSGKTTFMKTMLDLVPYKGEWLVDGVLYDKKQARSLIGYLSHKPLSLPLTLKETLVYGQHSTGSFSDDELWSALHSVGLSTWVMDNLPDKLNTQLYQYGGVTPSCGQSIRIALARLLLRKPIILLLDEPTSNLDKTTRKQFLNLLENEISKSIPYICIATHDDIFRDKAAIHLSLKCGKLCEKRFD